MPFSEICTVLFFLLIFPQLLYPFVIVLLHKPIHLLKRISLYLYQLSGYLFFSNACFVYKHCITQQVHRCDNHHSHGIFLLDFTSQTYHEQISWVQHPWSFQQLFHTSLGFYTNQKQMPMQKNYFQQFFYKLFRSCIDQKQSKMSTITLQQLYHTSL